MTQNERILQRLREGALCSMEPLEWTPRITRTGARIWDLIHNEGQPIRSASTCHLHAVPQGHAVYELAENEGRLF